MDDMVTLFLLSLAMLIGCYLSGIIPLVVNLSEEKLRLVTVLGAGLLVGTALAVIIPEGVHTLYETKAAHDHVPSKKDEVSTGTGHAGHEHGHEHDHEHGHTHSDLHTLIGIALVLGFVFMLLVDQIGGGAMHSHGTVDTENGTPTIQNRNKITATLGLVVHAAADGVALGAAATTSQTHVEMIVFVAIMLHKAPAAFGLVSFLLHEGFDRTRIRKHLLIFSLAAPIMSIVTYFGLSQQSKETLAHVNFTGIAMLFSAGTFLYVATVHILPELQNMGNTTNVNGTVIVREHQGFKKTELFLLVLGSLLPVVLSLGHHH